MDFGLDANDLSYWFAYLVPIPTYPAQSGIPQPQPIFQEGFVALNCELISFKTVLMAARVLTFVIFKAANGRTWPLAAWPLHCPTLGRQ